jgi:hypothetical protein
MAPICDTASAGRHSLKFDITVNAIGKLTRVRAVDSRTRKIRLLLRYDDAMVATSGPEREKWLSSFDKAEGYVKDLDGDDMTFDTLDEAEKLREHSATRFDACV